LRFNSPEHLATWREHGRFPAIHDQIASMAAAHMRGTRFLDLGCSYGLLGTRIMKQAGAKGVGVDSDKDVLAAAIAAGIPLQLEHLGVNRVSLALLADIVRDRNATVLIARRILPELFGEDQLFGWEFADVMALAGIDEILLEGRVDSAKSVNPLRSVVQEVELLDRYYREVRRIGAVSYLVRR
jgi:SAM-dependent methyltransferase